MKVILREDVKDLGEQGEVKDVSRGYARNYLIPRGLAVEATKGTLKDLELQRQKQEQEEQKEQEVAQDMKEKLEKETITISQKTGEGGRLFGSVTNNDVAKELKQRGYTIEKKKIEMEPIKSLGTHKVNVKLHSEVTAELEVKVAAEEASE